MKQKLYNIVILVIACIMFFVGTGATIMQICCSSCFDNIVSAGVCHPVGDNHENGSDTHSCCTDTSHEGSECSHSKHHSGGHKDECCKIERISVDIDNIISKTTLDYTPVWVTTLFSDALFNTDVLTSDFYRKGGSNTDPPPLPPRNYLSLISILII